MKKIKKEHRIYAAWNFDKEIDRYNQKSNEGWHAIKMGCFRQVYEWDETISYRYQIDFNHQLSDRERYHYIAAFEEQGWEYINSTFNGWHCFRKKYQAELPEEEYEIYTDTNSKQEMLGRWMKLAGIIAVLFGLQLILRIWEFCVQINLSNLCYVLMFLLGFLLLSLGCLSMQRMKNGIKAKMRTPVGIILLCIVAVTVANLYFVFNRPVHSCNFVTEVGQFKSPQKQLSDDYFIQNEFNVVYADFYYLNLKMKNDFLTEFAVIDADGNVVYKAKGKYEVSVYTRLKLKKGKYYIGIAVDSSVDEHERMEIRYEVR